METNWQNDKPKLYIIKEVKRCTNVQVQKFKKCNIAETNKVSQLAAIYYSKTNTERTMTRNTMYLALVLSKAIQS